MHLHSLKQAFLDFSSREAIGMAFLRAWSTSFFSSALIFGVFSDKAGWGSTAHNLSLLAFMATFLIVGAFSQSSFVLKCTKLHKTAAFATVVGSALIALAVAIPDFHSILIVIGGVITGIGSSLITVSWGKIYIHQCRRNIYWTTLGIYFFASMIALAFSACSFFTIVIFASISPAISVLYLKTANNGQSEETFSVGTSASEPRTASLNDSRFLGFLTYIALTSVVIGSVGAFCNEKTALPFDAVSLIVAGIIIVSAAIYAVLGELSMKALLTGTSFVLAIFFLLLPFLLSNQAVIALGVAAKSHGWIVIWTFIVYEATRAKGDSVRYIGLGMGTHYLGTLCGQGLVALVRGSSDEVSPIPLFALSLICMFILVASYLVALSTLNQTDNASDQNNDENIDSAKDSTTVHPFDRKVASASEHYGLTEREQEIMWHLAKGYSSKAIQTKLFISASTVSAHSGNIYRKMGVHSKEEVGDIVRSWEDPISKKSGGRNSE